MKLSDISIKFRLILVIGFLSLLLILLGLGGLNRFKANNQSLEQVYKEHVVALGLLDKISNLINRNQIYVAEIVSGQLSDFPEELSAVDQQVAEIKALIEKINVLWEAYASSQLKDKEAQLAAAFDEHRKSYGSQGLMPAVAALVAHDFQQASELLQGSMKATYPAVRQAIEALIQHQLDVTRERFDAAQAEYKMVRNLSTAVIGLGVLFASLIGYWVIRSISHPLNQAVAITQRIASGHLNENIQVHSGDETGKLMAAIQSMNKSLRNIVREVHAGTENILSTSSDIATGNLDLSQRTQLQTTSLESTASSMNELTTTVRQNAENAALANDLVSSTSSVAQKGGQVVGEVITTMESINEASERIADIISVIDGIAFQTNLLALNAAVEAARAGEHGRGFAVVASEVRNLAQRSAEAARDIKDLIENSVERVNTGTRLVDEAGKTMAEIVASVDNVTTLMSDIATASQQQSAGIETINQSLLKVDETTHQNAALVEQATTAAESLKAQADKLNEAVSVFDLGDTATVPHNTSHQSVATVTPLPNPSQTSDLDDVTPWESARAVGDDVNWERF